MVDDKVSMTAITVSCRFALDRVSWLLISRLTLVDLATKKRVVDNLS